MKPLRFEGHSDDTFGEYGRVNEDYDNCASGKPIVFKVTAPDGDGLHVVGQYAVGAVGCWSVGVQPLDEDTPIPTWPMRFVLAERGYSPALIIEAPDHVTITHVPNG
jgi:hypothetical protein